MSDDLTPEQRAIKEKREALAEIEMIEETVSIQHVASEEERAASTADVIVAQTPPLHRDVEVLVAGRRLKIAAVAVLGVYLVFFLAAAVSGGAGFGLVGIAVSAVTALLCWNWPRLWGVLLIALTPLAIFVIGVGLWWAGVSNNTVVAGLAGAAAVLLVPGGLLLAAGQQAGRLRTSA